MKREIHVAVAKIIALIASVLVFGCAPPSPGPLAPNRLAGVKGAASNMASMVSDGEWRCPDDDNILPKDYIGPNGYDYSGSNSFRACVGRTSQSRFKISGATTSRAVCVYPMHSGYGGGDIALAASPKCFAVDGSPIVAEFSSSANINYLVIVDTNFTNAMNACLSSASPCPAHAEGFVQ